MTQLVMFIPQHADDELSKEPDEDRSVDCLLCPAACRANVEFVFYAIEQLLHSVFFTIVLERFVK